MSNLMLPDDVARHMAAVAGEIDWLVGAIDLRLRMFLGNEGSKPLAAPPKPDPASGLGRVIEDLGLDADARLVLALSLAPHLAPAVLDAFFVRNPVLERPFTEFGGLIQPQYGGFLPTAETAMFLIGGTDMVTRARAMHLFDPDHPLRTSGLVRLDAPAPGASDMSGALSVSAEYRSLLSTGKARKPDYSVDFPARRLTTALGWNDLVLSPEVEDQLEHIIAWLTHEKRILGEWGLGRSLAPGYRCLFYGPPGTGKTLSAALLGQRTKLDVYRIDLSMVVSKYIGETEKNLAGVFDQAAHKNWILFFDEADALFGARGSGGSTNERYANQEVAYLLQRIETCPSLVILATNLRGNIDDAFARRFQSMVGFVRPDAAQRLRLWEGVFAGGLRLAKGISLEPIAEAHDMTGGAIINAVRYAAISALRRGHKSVDLKDLKAGITSELRKEGRTI